VSLLAVVAEEGHGLVTNGPAQWGAPSAGGPSSTFTHCPATPGNAVYLDNKNNPAKNQMEMKREKQLKHGIYIHN